MAWNPPAAFNHTVPWTPSDTALTPWITHGIYVSVAGNLNVTDENGIQSILAVPVGWLTTKVKQIWATSTTATITLIAN